MTSYLYLPRDLSLDIHLLSKEEHDAIIPSKYEIMQLNIMQLAKQLVANTEAYQDDFTSLSPGLETNLRMWMVVANDKRIFDLAEYSSKAIDNIWKTAFIFQKYPKINPQEIAEKINFVPGKIHPLLDKLQEILGQLFSRDGDVKSLMKHFHLILADPEFVATYLNLVLIIGKRITQPFLTFPKLGIDIMEDFLQLVQSYNLVFYETSAKIMLANLYGAVSNHDTAISIYDEVEHTTRKHGFEYMTNVAVNNRGLNYMKTGQWHKAEETFIILHDGDPSNSTYLNNLSDVYYNLGKTELAWEYGKQFLKNTNSLFVDNFEYLQPILHELGLEDEQDKLIERVRNIHEIFQMNLNYGSLLLMEARYSRYNHNLGTALDQINESIDLNLKSKNLTLLFRLLVERINIHLDLYEMKSTSNNKQRLFNSVDSFIQLSDDQGLAMGSIEGLRIRGGIYQRFDNMQAAREDLYNAAKLAQEFDYQTLYREISTELDEIREVDSVDEKQQRSIFSSIKKKLHQVLGRQTTDQKYTLQEFTTHGSIIMSNSGLPIYTNYITDKLKTDSALISGLISAVSSMLNEATQSKGYLKTIQRDDFSLLFEPLQDYLVVVIVSKDSFEARQKLQKFTKSTRHAMNKYELNKGNIPYAFEQELNTAVKEVLIN